MLELTRSVAERAKGVASVAAHNLATQDVIALAFHGYLFTRVLLAPDSPDAALARSASFTLLMATVFALLLTRGELIQPQRARVLTYRLGLFVPMALSYFEMRFLLPALQLELMDYQLYAVDRALLGTTPAAWFTAWNHPGLVEWLSFFYYSHFAVLIVMLVPSLFLQRGRRLQELMVGALVIVAAGHVLYTAIPGMGPFSTLHFEEPLHGGYWWRQVQITVATAGAKLDIFPSLHTAFPVYFANYAFAYRSDKAFRWAWPVLAFIAVNIVFATMFLRWHWFIDVVAGIVLAVVARRVSVWVTHRERHRGGLYDERQPSWESLPRA
ncbi:MAG: phosphatase PAP2 family protein [Myxococcota bacterium]